MEQLTTLVIIVATCTVRAEVGVIIQSELADDDFWPEEELYTNHLECEYNLKFENLKYTYLLHCNEYKDQSGKSVFKARIKYHKTGFDTFKVTSCKPENVVGSIFPPGHKTEYGADDEVDKKKRPTKSYLKFKNTEGKCFARSYKYEYDEKAASRSSAVPIRCEGQEGPEPEWTTYGDVARFANCRVPRRGPPSAIVVTVGNGDYERNHEVSEKTLLQCSFEQYSSEWKLICDKEETNNEYLAYVSNNGRVIEEFTVTSCAEEKIVNGIFPVRVTTANPYYWCWVNKIYFRKLDDKECYRRDYDTYFDHAYNVLFEDCPTEIEKWTNPTWGKVAMWSECKGTMSHAERPGQSEDDPQTAEPEVETTTAVPPYVAQAGKGVVVGSELPNDNSWPPEGVRKYKHHLECDYRHQFPGHHWTYAIDLHCNEWKEESGNVLKVDLNYDNSVLDIFTVKSCKPEDIVASVFPPQQKEETPKYGKESNTVLKWKNTEGKCFARKYFYKNRRASAATRTEVDPIQCEGDQVTEAEKAWTTHGEVAKFTNCRDHDRPATPVVVSALAQKEDTGSWDEPAPQPLLQCTFDQFSALWKLVCVEGGKPGEYFAFVTYQGTLLDKFTVDSCEEEKIVYGIFPAKDTTYYPKYDCWIPKIWFRKTDGQCYRRDYPRSARQGLIYEECPPTLMKWANPSWGRMGIWRECTKGKEEISKEPQQQSKEEQRP